MSRPVPRHLSRKEQVAIAKMDHPPARPTAILPYLTGPPELADDLLYGAAAIAAYLFGDEAERRKVYGLVESGQLPVFRLGTILCARKSTIVRAVEAREREAAAAGVGRSLTTA